MAFPEGHPYHHPTIGSMDDLDAASLHDVREFFSTWYAPNNAVLTVVGDIDEAEVRSAVERWFGPIAANPALPAHADLELKEPLAATRKTIRDRVPDPRLHVAFRLPPLGDPTLPAAEVACQILASGRGSRLHRRLVRDEQVAQDVSLGVLAFAGGASLAVGAATLRPGASSERLERCFDEELARLAAEGPTATEMERAAARIESEEMAKLGDPEDLADEIGEYATLLNDPGRAFREVEIYRAVTAEQVRSAAKAFDPLRRATLWYEPDGAASA